jgi:pyruvate,orthophosphate dikinase
MLSRGSNSIDNSIFRIPFDGPAALVPDKDVVGSKAHNLMRMASSGLPVPPGFVISTDVCRRFLAKGNGAHEGLPSAMARETERLGTLTRRHFGDAKRPLLLSVRSGAAVSMPGMMETVLNIGLNEAALSGIVRMTGNSGLHRTVDDGSSSNSGRSCTASR